MSTSLTLVAAAALVFGACTAAVESNGGTDAATRPDGPGGDASIACKTLFLNFEGGTVTMGPDDAAANKSTLSTGTSTLTAFAAADGSRAARISAIRDQVANTLGDFSLEVTTTRPSSGTYHMVFIGGQPEQLGTPANVSSIGPASCGEEPVMSKGIAFVFELTGLSDVELANYAVQQYGFMLDVPPTTKSGDCMCQQCTLSAACTIGGADTQVDVLSAPCDETGTIDEHAKFAAALTCP